MPCAFPVIGACRAGIVQRAADPLLEHLHHLAAAPADNLDAVSASTLAAPDTFAGMTLTPMPARMLTIFDLQPQPAGG